MKATSDGDMAISGQLCTTNCFGKGNSKCSRNSRGGSAGQGTGMIKMTREAKSAALPDFAHQVASAILVLLQESAKQPVELLHKVETLMNLVWERLNTGHWAKVTASPLGRNTHWVLRDFWNYSSP